MAAYAHSFPLLANWNVTGSRTPNDIVALSTGGYLVTWSDRPQNATGSEIKARVYSASGQPVSAEFTVGEGNTSSATALPGGGFAIVFGAKEPFANTATNISARVYDSAGGAKTGPIVLDQLPAGETGASLGSVSVSLLTDGRFAAVWGLNPRQAPGPYSANPQTAGRVFGTILAPDGTPTTGRLQLGAVPSNNGTIISLAIAPLNNGGFAVARDAVATNLGQLSVFAVDGQVDLQIFNATGQPTTDSIFLDGNAQTSVSAVMLADGRVAIGYGAGESSVFRLVSTDGTVSSSRVLGSNAAVSSRFGLARVGRVDLSATADGNILAVSSQYFPTPKTGAFQDAFTRNVVGIYSPDGEIRQSISTSSVNSVFLSRAEYPSEMVVSIPQTIGLVQGSIAVLRDNPVTTQAIITQVYQPTVPTFDPDGSSLVNDAYYKVLYSDIAADGIDPDLHYAEFGWKEGRSPNPLFDTAGYLSANSDVAAANGNPLGHHSAYGWKEGRDPSVHFDDQLYLARNRDVAQAGVDPLEHYLQYGQAEGRDIYPAIGNAAAIIHGSFDSEYYLLANHDVGRAVRGSSNPAEAAYQHYQTFGWREGRNPNAYFDTSAYLAAYQDVKGANIDPLMHYDTAGWREGRDPSGRFDTSSYLTANPDVAALDVNPLQRFLTSGALEGRLPLGDGTIG